jgi:major membrane immunogen (membrane-anchored lipoprotein)
MKIITVAIVLLLAATAASADKYVQGHTRSDGTYVQGHYRSDANNTQSDNWTTRGNTNPYTGQAGTRRDCTYGCN